MFRVALIILLAGAGGIYLGSAATSQLLQPNQVQLAATTPPVHKAKSTRLAVKLQLNSPWLPVNLQAARPEYVSLTDDMRRAGKRKVAMTAHNSREAHPERISF